ADDRPRPTGVGAPLALATALVNGRATIAAAPRDAETYIRLGLENPRWWIPAGQEREVRLSATHIRELLRITLCDPDGSPAASRSFSCGFDGFERDFTFRGCSVLHTDERGRAAIALEDVIPAGGRFLVYDESDPPQRAFVDCAALRSVPGPRVALRRM